MNQKWHPFLIIVLALAAALLLVTTTLAQYNPWGDSDGDGVNDYICSVEFYENCFWEGGIWAPLDLCPDTLPNTPVDSSGCPVEPPADSDGDNVPDSADQCPQVAGPESNGGCPVQEENHNPSPIDWDHDGLVGADDYCPELPGVRDSGGCPWLPKPEPAAQLGNTFDPSLPAEEFRCENLTRAFVWVHDEDQLIPQVYCQDITLELAEETRLAGFEVLNAVLIPTNLPGAAREEICLQGEGRIVVLPLDGGEPLWMPAVEYDGYTCAAVPALGVMALVAAE